MEILMGFTLQAGKHEAWAISSNIAERRYDEPVHFSMAGIACIACGITLNPKVTVWTDEEELYDNHHTRCNFAYKASED